MQAPVAIFRSRGGRGAGVGLAAGIFVLFLAAWVAPASAARTPLLDVVAAASPDAPVAADTNVMDVRQFHIENAQVPGVPVRQTVTAWQVTQGSWNGRALDGLCVVLVQSNADSESSRGQTTCYLSHDATPAQREALLAAFVALQPQLFSPRDLAGMRVEPAVITLEIDGQNVVLHVGLVA